VAITKNTIRIRFGVQALIVAVAVCALIFSAMRVSQDSRPAYLYAAWLGKGDTARGLHAAQELDHVEESQSLVLARLLGALNDPDHEVRKQSARSLGRVVCKEDLGHVNLAVRGLVQVLNDKNPAVRRAAADALGQLAPDLELALMPLLIAVEDSDEWVRGSALTALGLIQNKARVDNDDVRLAIIAAANDPSVHVREMGVDAFLATAEGSPQFSRDLLNDDDVVVRRMAVNALARSGPLAEKVVPELTASLTDQDATVSAGAERALENIGGGAMPE
jgi:HEAT repeat protein